MGRFFHTFPTPSQGFYFLLKGVGFSPEHLSNLSSHHTTMRLSQHLPSDPAVSLKNASPSFISYHTTPMWLLLSLPPSLGGFGTSRFHSLLFIGRPPFSSRFSSEFWCISKTPSCHTTQHPCCLYYFIAFHFLLLQHFPPRGQRFLFPLLSPSSQEISFLVHLVVSLKNTTLSHTPLPATGPSLVVGSHHPTRQPFG